MFYYQLPDGKFWVPEVERSFSCPHVPARLLYVVVPSSDSLSELSCFRAAIRLSFIFLCQQEKRTSVTGALGLNLSATAATVDLTHLGDPLFAPLADSLADAHDAFHGTIQSLLHLLQRRHHGDVGDGEGHAGSEDGLLTAAPATTGHIALS